MSLVVHDLVKSFEGLTVLDRVSFTVGATELAGLIGPNGAGKSTLFAVISGFEKPDAGTVGFANHALKGVSVAARVRLGLSRTFQIPRPFSHLTVRENLASAAPNQVGEHLTSVFVKPRKVRAQEAQIRERAEELLDFLTLDRVADSPAADLSGGQRKLLELGRALMTEPTFLLLDEPFAGVNPTLIEVLAERIRQLHADGIGCLIVEHNLLALRSLVERMIVMDWGKILADATPDEALSDPAVQNAYIGGRGISLERT